MTSVGARSWSEIGRSECFYRLKLSRPVSHALVTSAYNVTFRGHVERSHSTVQSAGGGAWGFGVSDIVGCRRRG